MIESGEQHTQGRQLLVSAIERGYFETPRKTTLSEVAEAQDLTDEKAIRCLNRAIEDWACRSEGVTASDGQSDS